MLIYDKLNSIEWGATRNKNEKKASFSGSITGTNTAKEICRWKMNADEWCETGILECEITGVHENSVATDLFFVFTLDVADAPPTEDSEAAADYGKLQSFSTAYSFAFPAIPASGGTPPGNFIFELRLCANGASSGTAWEQRGHASLAASNLLVISPQQDSEVTQVVKTTIDPTVDKWFRLTFKSANALGAGQQIVVKSAHARLLDGR